MKFYESGEFRASRDWPYAIAAGGVVYRIVDKKIEVLLLLRKAGDFPELFDSNIDSYHLPKGHVELSEAIEDAAVREIKEESGCRVELSTYLGASHSSYTFKNQRFDKSIHYFAALWVEDVASMDQEHSGKIWCLLDEAIEKIGNKNLKQENVILERLKSFLEAQSAS